MSAATVPTVAKSEKLAKPEKAKVAKPPKEKKDRPVFNAPSNVKFPYVLNNGKATPVDFDHGKHRPLKPEAFETKVAFITYKAEQMEWRAAQMRQRATDVAAGKPVGKVKQLTRMMEKMEELKVLLASQGIDVAALIAQSQPATK